MLTSFSQRNNVVNRHKKGVVPDDGQFLMHEPSTHASQDLARLYARPGFLLRRAHQISAAVFEDECSSVGLTPAQFGVLTVLASAPGLDQSSLARALGFDKVTVLRVLRGLEERGLVLRSTAVASKRNMSVVLSPDGEQLLKQAAKPAEQAYERLMAPLSTEQRTQLVMLLMELTQGLEDSARAAFVPPTPR
jgi:MarR family transcriptional regulator, lower aerobic nicotinate degradation pathway regulator